MNVCPAMKQWYLSTVHGDIIKRSGLLETCFCPICRNIKVEKLKLSISFDNASCSMIKCYCWPDAYCSLLCVFCWVTWVFISLSCWMSQRLPCGTGELRHLMVFSSCSPPNHHLWNSLLRFSIKLWGHLETKNLIWNIDGDSFLTIGQNICWFLWDDYYTQVAGSVLLK